MKRVKLDKLLRFSIKQREATGKVTNCLLENRWFVVYIQSWSLGQNLRDREETKTMGDRDL